MELTPLKIKQAEPNGYAEFLAGRMLYGTYADKVFMEISIEHSGHNSSATIVFHDEDLVALRDWLNTAIEVQEKKS